MGGENEQHVVHTVWGRCYLNLVRAAKHLTNTGSLAGVQVDGVVFFVFWFFFFFLLKRGQTLENQAICPANYFKAFNNK